MLFCEKCNFLTDKEYCPVCGSSKLRQVKGEDFCYFAQLNTMEFEMLESALKEKGVDVVGMPFYTKPVIYSTAGRAQARRVFVRYKDLNKAREIYDLMFS